MKKKNAITTLFIDVGGVLLTNGWDHQARVKASKLFHLDLEEMESRHRLTFDTYEVGKITLEEYLNRIVFYEKRSFTQKQFQKFMFEQSKPYPDMIKLISDLKAKHNLKVGVVSNEGKELTEYRVRKFKLGSFVDFFIASGFVHLRKPDADIYRLALDVAQVPIEEIVYIEDRAMFVDVAKGLGIHGILHTNAQSTRKHLASLGLKTS